jgi:hypothetical protein
LLNTAHAAVLGDPCWVQHAQTTLHA